MKKLINIRLPLLCVLALCLGIFSFYRLLFGEWWVIVSCLAVIAATATAFVCFRKKYWIYCLVAIAFVLIGFFDFFLAYHIRNEDKTVVHTGVLSGRVTDIGRNGEEPKNTIYLENCIFDGEKIDGRVMIYVYDGSAFDTGDEISVYGTLRNAYAVKARLKTYYVRNRIYYQLTDTDNFITQSGELNLGERVRRFVYQTTAVSMPQNGSVAYALLTGDRNALAETQEEAYTDAGIIHILSVSGLHVGFIVTVFGFLLEKLRLKPLWQLLILSVPLIMYAYICDFASTVMRAAIMTVCLYVTRILHGRYDLLTSLSCAALLILLAQPLYLFDVGFQLSVISVFGMATVYSAFARWAARIKINKYIKKLLQTVMMSVACVASTMFLSAYVFESFVWLGILVNIVAIPLVFVSFLLSIVGLAPWIFRYAATISDKILQVLTSIAEKVQSFELSISIKTTVWGIFISLALLFVLGGYVNISRKGKGVVYGVGVLLLAMCVGIAYIPKNCKNCVTVFCGFESSAFVATSSDGEVAIVCVPDEYNATQTVNYLSDKRVGSLTLYITDSEAADFSGILLILENYPDCEIILLDGYDENLNAAFETQGIVPKYADYNQVYGKDVTVQSIYDVGFAGVVVKVNGISLAQVNGGEARTRHFAELRRDVNFYAVTCAEAYYAEQNLSTLTRYGQNVEGNFGANRYGNFTIEEKFGIITLNFWGN